ncbi:LLM class flavin-dependent oxidoreductase [Amycolatopsis jejuensis]|uniref:LLM class flavin-dependent oxidoreductase n=1 Tax=Amycolatopsis jejuensis TaxID=330084 RepID=UPI000526E663|nr:LLM class flavin-dependent oxidoreductase [Amycolatopsis jejuensis]
MLRVGAATQGYIRNDSTVYDRVREVVREGQAADEAGLDLFGMSEQHFKFPTNATGAMEVFFSALAATTSRIRLQPGAVIPPLHHPLNLAERWGTIDILSGGRLDFAVGRGNTPLTAQAFQVPLAETNDRTRESLEIIVKAWTSEHFEHHGKFYSFPSVRVNPPSCQRPHPPLALAATSVGAARLAGSMRVGLMITTNGFSWENVQDRIDAYRAAWETGETIAGAAPNRTICAHVPGHLAASFEVARRQVEFGVVEYANRAIKQRHEVHLKTYGSTDGIESSAQFVDNFDSIALGAPAAFGSPDDVLENLVRLHRMGAGELVVHHDYGRHEELLESIRLLGTEVKPALLAEVAGVAAGR